MKDICRCSGKPLLIRFYTEPGTTAAERGARAIADFFKARLPQEHLLRCQPE
jgi:hypothetical protein